jgi:hypothetical protein
MSIYILFQKNLLEHLEEVAAALMTRSQEIIEFCQISPIIKKIKKKNAKWYKKTRV